MKIIIVFGSGSLITREDFSSSSLFFFFLILEILIRDMKKFASDMQNKVILVFLIQKFHI